ncbi:MAG: type III polyketide synthase [Opitutales bacterium]
MYLHAIARAVPETSFTQPECWELLRGSTALGKLNARSQSLLERVLLGDSGIDKRHFAIEQIEQVFDLDAQALNEAFERHASRLAAGALEKALHRSGTSPESLDALLICTCTGYLCPGLSSHVSERLGLRPNTYLQDIVGLGCGAAIPMLRAAKGMLAAQPASTVACIAVEVCSTAFYLADDPGVLISACLFGDGASATIWKNEATAAGYRIHNFDTIHKPHERELLRFVNDGGKLRNQLHRSVPEHAAEAVAELRARSGATAAAPIAAHTGGRDVLDALEAKLDAPPLAASRRMLRDYGNTSSPSVLFVLEELLSQDAAPEAIWLTSFGAGFAAHACELTRLPE